MEIGYALSSEEHPPQALVDNAQRAEETGFSFALISDHFHPWVDHQGHSAFVWSVLGGIAQTTSTLRVGTGVTCPLIRMHPAIVAHAAATVATMMPGRFFLGLGTGENLNEHITGERWPAIDERLVMLEEAIDVIRRLWSGEEVTRRGQHYTVDHARLYTTPDEPPPIYLAASGDRVATVAGQLSDGLISTAPKKETVEAFQHAGGGDKPRLGMLHVCWAPDAERARETVNEWWPNGGIGGELGQELPLPRHFEQAARDLPADVITKHIPCGPDVDVHLGAIEEYASAGFDHVYVHQIGPEQEGFFDFYAKNVIPKMGRRVAA
jgi:coenzyme F420-dependent glucose-6-phosphate dehydrogenase